MPKVTVVIEDTDDGQVKVAAWYELPTTGDAGREFTKAEYVAAAAMNFLQGLVKGQPADACHETASDLEGPTSIVTSRSPHATSVNAGVG
jgi:hypothetical protein